MNGTVVGENAVDANGIVILSAMATFFLVNLIAQMTWFNQTSTSEFKKREPVQAPEGSVWREEKGLKIASPVEAESIKKKRESGEAKKFTWEEVSKHNKKDDLWLIVDGKVFNVTSFVMKHPGGFRPLVAMGGRDSTEVMNEFHPAAIFDKYLPPYYIGDLVDYEITPLLRDYRNIRQELLARGLFETNMTYYYAKFVWLLSIALPTIYGVLFCSSFFAHMASACGMALFWQQLAFVGHDLGHSAISHAREVDFFWGGLFGNFLGGISLCWWKHSHETHHVTCNSIEMDPDIQHLPFLAITEKIFRNKFWSTYHLKWFEMDAVARFFVSYQHIIFYPVMGLARFNLYAQSWILLLLRRDEPVPFKALEVTSLALFWVWFFAFISFLPTTGERVAYLLVSHALAGILHVQITLSHFISDTFHGSPSENWIKHQMITTTDITCPKYMDWFHGGLQFQLEHHLFPRLPRHNLRIARDRIIELSAKYELPYNEMSFISANHKLMGILFETAQSARKATKGDGGFYQSPIFEALNAQG